MASRVPVFTGGKETAVSDHRAATSSLVLLLSLVLALPAAAQEQPPPPSEAPPAAAQGPQARRPGLAAGNPRHNGEVSFFVGGLVGGDLASLVTDGFSLSSTLENGRTYGGRVGYYSFPFGAEGSFAYSNSGLGVTASFDNATIAIAARVMYLEGNALLLLVPGPVQPFLTAGGGLHSYEFLDLAGIQLQKWGWNFGGGLKINVKRVSLRVDLRDHITRLTAADLNIDDELAELLNVGQQTLHNAEVSFGFGFRF